MPEGTDPAAVVEAWEQSGEQVTGFWPARRATWGGPMIPGPGAVEVLAESRA